MTKVKDITQLAAFLGQTKSAVFRAHTEIMIKLTLEAEALAKRNATKQFTGRNGRKLSGALLNSIYSGYETDDSGLPKGVIGTRGIPYGRIHEFGGTIVPKNAKWLWLKQWGGKADAFRRMTPTEFVDKLKQKDRRFKLIGKKGGKGKVAVFQALKDGQEVKLFALSKRVEMPERPYLRPAIEEVMDRYGSIAKKVMAKHTRSIK